ncbi:hypothetical protein ZWY2020_021302 [Hordeum vulgare]|nr:hypothetical protein ZWY2020_021302 [Hordeum vulgare]
MRRYSPQYRSPPRRGYGGRGRSPPRRGYGGRREQGSGSLLVRNIPLSWFAFVEFVDPYHLNRTLFFGREITVVVAAESRKRPEDMRNRARVREKKKKGGGKGRKDSHPPNQVQLELFYLRSLAGSRRPRSSSSCTCAERGGAVRSVLDLRLETRPRQNKENRQRSSSMPYWTRFGREVPSNSADPLASPWTPRQGSPSSPYIYGGFRADLTQLCHGSPTTYLHGFTSRSRFCGARAEPC